jgi:hypothetical protein
MNKSTPISQLPSAMQAQNTFVNDQQKQMIQNAQQAIQNINLPQNTQIQQDIVNDDDATIQEVLNHINSSQHQQQQQVHHAPPPTTHSIPDTNYQMDQQMMIVKAQLMDQLIVIVKALLRVPQMAIAKTQVIDQQMAIVKVQLMDQLIVEVKAAMIDPQMAIVKVQLIDQQMDQKLSLVKAQLMDQLKASVKIVMMNQQMVKKHDDRFIGWINAGSRICER